LNAAQNITAAVFFDVIVAWASNMQLIFDYSAGGMVVESSLLGQVQAALPSNQWQIEIEAWHATVLATIQQQFIGHATGPTDPTAWQFILPPATNAESQICGAQRARISQGFSNVSVLGLLIVMCVGGTIISISICIERVVALFGRRWEKLGEQHKHWIREDVLQLQRIAYEGQTRWEWERTDRVIPTLCSDCRLGPLHEKRERVSTQGDDKEYLGRTSNDIQSSVSTFDKSDSKEDIEMASGDSSSPVLTTCEENTREEAQFI
jgi:hypothetical protein